MCVKFSGIFENHLSIMHVMCIMTRESNMNSSSLAIGFLCPICHKLPLDHVVAEDGFIYCRKCIEEFLHDNGISPMLGIEMGKLLINSEVIAETIRDLIQCEDINKSFLPSSASVGDVEEEERLNNNTADEEIPQIKHEAQDNDINNAYHGYCLITGKEGVEKDWEEGFEILVETAIQKSNDKARGKPLTFSFSVVHVITSARLISPLQTTDFAAHTLGCCYEHGILGFKCNEKNSKKWYNMVHIKPPNAHGLFAEFMIDAETIPETVEANVDETICSSLLSPSVNSSSIDGQVICTSCSETITSVSGSCQSKLCQSCKVIGSVKG